jgi:hypothetical protein
MSNAEHETYEFSSESEAFEAEQFEWHGENEWGGETELKRNERHRQREHSLTACGACQTGNRSDQTRQLVAIYGFSGPG